MTLGIPVDDDIRHKTTAGTMVHVIGLVDCACSGLTSRRINHAFGSLIDRLTKALVFLARLHRPLRFTPFQIDTDISFVRVGN